MISGWAVRKMMRVSSPSVLLEARGFRDESRMLTGGSAMATAEASGTLGSSELDSAST